MANVRRQQIPLKMVGPQSQVTERKDEGPGPCHLGKNAKAWKTCEVKREWLRIDSSMEFRRWIVKSLEKIAMKTCKSEKGPNSVRAN
jgi:hypothetical protein